MIDRVGAPDYAPPDRHWATRRCGFPDVAGSAIADDDDRPTIAIIDCGSGGGLAESGGRIVKYVAPQAGGASRARHGGAVAGVIAQACKAPMHLYNTWTADGLLDRASYHAALLDVATERVAVVNLSFGSRVPDPIASGLIRECGEQGTVFVAAMGDLAHEGSPVLFPAADPGVIAVGATDRWDRRLASSNTGRHLWIAAPGEDVWTPLGAAGPGARSGTSFAAPLVSAAVWLVLCAMPAWGPAEIRPLLAESAAARPVGEWDEQVGYGRLDVARMLAVAGRG